tara:strand:+ start:2006 stop:2728 length:723 start_codon:yes stop_codon:yes gene_type:complete
MTQDDIESGMERVTAGVVLQAYAQGYFPMAESGQDKGFQWIYPYERGILPIEDFHIPKSLLKFLRKNPFKVTVNQEFERVIKACAQTFTGTEREETWINDDILALYLELHDMGHAHSVEVWDKISGDFCGGLYGLSLGSAFFGESMVSLRSNASKTALCYLVARLHAQGFVLLDAQFPNDHLMQFGCQTIKDQEYMGMLSDALAAHAQFYCAEELGDAGVSAAASESFWSVFLQSRTQMS